MAIFRPYHYGAYKWDDYLLDIQDAIKGGNLAQRQGVQCQDEALEVAREQAEELSRQTTYIHQIGETLESGFEELRSEFQWGFTLMVDRMDTQIEQLAQVTAKLDAIHKTLQSPLLTQAKELFQLGQENYRKGLLDKALEAYLKAEEKNEVYFPLQLQIGKLFLYGRDEDDDVINLPEAERHHLLAARYAGAEKGTVPEWNRYCGEAYFHAAVAAYLIGGQEQAARRMDSMRACLVRALGHLTKAATIWPRFAEIVYLEAKCHALLGQTQQAVQKLEILSDRDRRYFAKATQDRDFESLGAEVETVFRRATITPGPLAAATQAKLDELAEAVLWARRSEPSSNEDLAVIESTEREISNARGSLPTLDVDIEALGEKLSHTRVNLDRISQPSFQNNIHACEQAIASLEFRKNQCDTTIQQLRETMRYSPGTRLGCVFSFVLFICALFAVGIVLSLPSVTTPGPILLTISLGLCAAAAGGVLLGSKVSRDSKKRSRAAIEENSRVIEECTRQLSPLRQRAQTLKEDRRSFEAWQAHCPSPSLRLSPGEEGTPFSVTLISPGANRINVMRVVREVTGFDLKQVKDLVDNAPQLVKRGVNWQEAEAIRRKFADAGAKVEIG